MEVFFSSITSGSIGEKTGPIYFPMFETLKSLLLENDYGSGLDCWFLAFVIRGPKTPSHAAPERVLWKKKACELDRRLTVNFEAFKRGSEQMRRNLLMAYMRRSPANTFNGSGAWQLAREHTAHGGLCD